MTREQLRTIYAGRIDQNREAIRRRTRIINAISLLRLVAGVLLVFSLVRGIRESAPAWYALSFLMLVLFLFLVSRHNRLKELRELLRQLELLNKTELGCIDHHFQDQPDGARYAAPSHPWAHDLDIFGKGSLFQYLNRTATSQGNQKLAALLTEEPRDLQAITDRQGIIGDLKDRIDFRQDFTARGRLIPEKPEDLADIAAWIEHEAYITRHRWLFHVALTMCMLALGVITAGFLHAAHFRFLIPLVLFNWFLLAPFFRRTNQYQASISKKHELLEGFAELLSIIAGTPFKHPLLEEKATRAASGTRAVAKLSRLLNLFDQRLNMLLGVILNLLFLYDFIMLHLLERWKRKHREQILEWIGLSAWTDAMISLGGFAFNHPGFTVPDMTGQHDTLEMEGLGHPLIPDMRRVVNDLRLGQERVVIITGANMAGKSTFLRSLGINMVLAYNGCPVCATRFRAGLMGLFTSMRTSDSLADEESYFLAEIRRLQGIVKRMETGEPLLILLDEVLKGTNTTDKRKGSVGLIRRALHYPVRCFIATHDLSLGAMEAEHPGEVVNYCFESYIRDLELTFDYSIRKGIATNMNASFLMKQMGIMD